MENQEEEDADDLMEEIDLNEAEDRTDLADPHEDAEKIVYLILIVLLNIILNIIVKTDLADPQTLRNMFSIIMIILDLIIIMITFIHKSMLGKISDHPYKNYCPDHIQLFIHMIDLKYKYRVVKGC